MRPVTVVSYVAQLGQFRLETRTALKKTELLFKVGEGGKMVKISDCTSRDVGALRHVLMPLFVPQMF